MRKAAIGLGLVGLLGYNIATTDIAFAQRKYEPIKFGAKSELTYQASDDPFEVYKDEKTKPDGKNFGKVHLRKDGVFRLWGVLDGTFFYYNAEDNMLRLYKDGKVIEFTDNPRGSNEEDEATVYLPTTKIGINIKLGSSTFYEGPKPTKPVKELSEKEALHWIFSDYMDRLNVGAVRTLIGKSQAEIKPGQIRKALDEFLK